MNGFKAEFDKLAVHGYVGDPTGLDAYAYLRASTERQVEEGSSFPRQLESVHKAAQRDGLRIPFELIFFDDGFTGFEFEHRPALLKLRYEAQSNPRAKHLVIEDIDRLSRNADWQQGFLLEEFTRRHIEVHFHIHPGSQLERYVRGYIAQEGMKKDIERQQMGKIYKAMSGKVTAGRPRYGYRFNDAKDDYLLHEEEATVVRSIFEKLIYEGWTINQIAEWLNENRVPTRFKLGYWSRDNLYNLVKDPIYKGEFYAYRHRAVKTGELNTEGRPKLTMKLRPQDEWIKVEVPAIVTPNEWDMAQQALARNRSVLRTNHQPGQWLLRGWVKCDVCRESSLVGSIGGSKNRRHLYYVCLAHRSARARKLGKYCPALSVRADLLERRVWEEVEQVIYEPDLLVKRLEKKQQGEVESEYTNQISFIEDQVADTMRERKQCERAYQQDISTLDEFEEEMKNLRSRARTLEASRAKLEVRLAEARSLQEQTQLLIAALAKIKIEIQRAKTARECPAEIPFDLKRKILSLLIKTIWVNPSARTFTLEGAVEGLYSFDSGSPS